MSDVKGVWSVVMGWVRLLEVEVLSRVMSEVLHRLVLGYECGVAAMVVKFGTGIDGVSCWSGGWWDEEVEVEGDGRTVDVDVVCRWCWCCGCG